MIYEYECKRCGTFEVIQSIHDAALTTCECGCPVERIITGGLGFTKETLTIGSLAEKNVAKLGHYERENKFRSEIESKEAAKKNAPWWRPNTTQVNRKLFNMNQQEQKRYIEGGK
jgi:putative FmdB family regulatory protein